MPRWLTDKLTWVLVFAAIAAASSSYGAYKIYLMTDGKPGPVPAKSKR
jgi:hypothetical protein